MPAPDARVSRDPVPLTPKDAARQAALALADLLATTFPDARSAADAVVAVVRGAGGPELQVLCRQGADDWRALTSTVDPPDAEALEPGNGHVVPGEPGEVAVVTPARVDASLREVLLQVATWLELHRERDIAAEAVTAAAHESEVLGAVTEQLRSVRDLDQVLHLIATRTLELLSSDICGVMLRDDDVVRMRACVGHRVADTAKLTMVRGQGVAGKVFETEAVGRVDDYLQDATISNDFMSLARREAAKSALAVPLILQGELIGVLEVWRRRASVFTDRDVSRLLTLADFASIAIDNARLVESQERTVSQLRGTQEALEQEAEVSRRTAALQHTLLDTVLGNPTLATLAGVVSRELGYTVGIYGPDGQLVAVRPAAEQGCLPEDLPPHLPSATWLVRQEQDCKSVRAHPVVVQDEQVGAVVVAGVEANEELMVGVCAQVAMACSLALLQDRVASRARAEALEQALWDLLNGSLEQRMAARSRTKQMGLGLIGPHRVLSGHISGLAGQADNPAAGERAAGIVHRLRGAEVTPTHSILALSGEHLVALVPERDDLEIRALLDRWSGIAGGGAAASDTTWGVSRSHSDPLELATAYQEAQTALIAARRLGGRQVALYDELGIVRLLLGSGVDADLKGFVDEITGPLLAYDTEHDGSLVQTMRAYFDADCSQRVAAERLFVHHKTMRYRLERIKQLTGLDLSRHEDRLRADVALRILQVGPSAGTGYASG